MQHPIHPADELARIRAEIRRLKLREATLREGFLRGDLPVLGLGASVSVRRTRRRVLVKDRLPDAILGDDRYWEFRETPAVVVQPLARHPGPRRDPAPFGRRTATVG